MDWKPGDRLTHRYNPELGPGIVASVEGRTLAVVFPATGASLSLAVNSGAIEPLILRPGLRARIIESGDVVTIAGPGDEGEVRLNDGRTMAESDLWPLELDESLTEMLATGRVDPFEAFSLRLDALHLASIREADGLGSFLGGRIRLFPHQLYAAEQSTHSDPVRWLLADEVGLGKTVEACLVLDHLLRTGRAEQTLVVAPRTLTVQWLGELWRKYHQVFVLLDDQRLADVERDYGAGFNPFDAHQQVIVAMETLIERPRLTEQAVEAGVDLTVVDEAHHLRRRPGHPGNADYRAIQPLAAIGRHLLLLTATPLEEDAHGFFRLLQLLRPEEFPEGEDFEARLGQRAALPPCTSATLRTEVGGLPPRAPRRVELGDSESWRDQVEFETALKSIDASNAVRRREKARRIRRGLASGAALEALLRADDKKLRALARRAMQHDPRVDWLAGQAREWRDRGDKTLVFVAHDETLAELKDAMSRRVQLRVGLFHEALSPGQRDIEVAQFRLAGGPSMLISTECGGEGRNFEFCTRLVLFDLPWNPIKVEQRIGRLDRIGREIPVEIVYFRPPGGIGAQVVDLYESLGLFEKPLGGVERELAGVETAIEEVALSDSGDAGVERFERLIAETRDALDRIQRAAYHELHRGRYDPSMAEEILGRVPEGLEELTQDVILAACEQLGFHVEELGGTARYSVEVGKRARVESLPGVPGTASFLGTFDRREAVEDESIDFFASGHPLVEGVMAYLEDGMLGRVGLLDIRSTDDTEGFGLVALYDHDGELRPVVIDSQGRSRPEWAERLTRRPLRSRRIRVDQWTGQPGWAGLIRDLATHLPTDRRPVTLAAFRIAP